MSEGQSLQIHRRFFVVASLACALLLLLTAGMNVAVDPTGEFESGWLPPMTDESRDVKVLRFASLPKDTKTLVFGSSRCMRVETDLLEEHFGGPAYNASVSAAGLRDHHALFTFAIDRQKLPIKELVLGLDLEAFAKSNTPDVQLVGREHMLAAIPETFRPEAQSGGAFRALNLDRALLSLKALKFEFVTGWKARAHTTDENGLRYYDAAEEAIAAGTYDLASEVDTTRRRYLQVFSDFPELDPAALEIFDALLERAFKAGIRVHVFLTPLHPRIVEALAKGSEFSERRKELVERLNAMAKDHDRLSFFDASEISSFGGDPALYYDGSHARSENMRRVMRHVLALSDEGGEK